MSRLKNPPADCTVCGCKYSAFRTGYTYDDIVEMLWSPDEDPNTWRYRRRGTVLGKWYEIKQEMWQDHIDNCIGGSITFNVVAPIEMEY